MTQLPNNDEFNPELTDADKIQHFLKKHVHLELNLKGLYNTEVADIPVGNIGSTALREFLTKLIIDTEELSTAYVNKVFRQALSNIELTDPVQGEIILDALDAINAFITPQTEAQLEESVNGYLLVDEGLIKLNDLTPEPLPAFMSGHDLTFDEDGNTEKLIILL